MTKIAIVPNAAGTGTFTIEAPNSNSNRTLTLPDSAGTVATAESTLAQFNATGSAPVYACRAWVNFNGTGTVAIRASGNVSSITDNGSGDYTVNFTTALADANYAALSTTEADSFPDRRFIAPLKFNARTTTSVGVWVSSSSANTAQDSAYVAIAIFR
jgi:hypothetical protein